MEAPLSNRYAEMAELSKKCKPMYYTVIVLCIIDERVPFTELWSTVTLGDLLLTLARIGDSCTPPLVFL
jgi:hypothetical protein